MVTCWASGLGACSTDQSGEHYVTRGLWSADAITISGFDWQGGQEKKISLGTLEANILCSTHNSQLSSVDAEAIRVFKFISQVIRSFQDWQIKSPVSPAISLKRYIADGKLFERWAAKTLIDFVCVDRKNDVRWHATDAPVLEPPIDVVRAIFGGTNFVRPMGLYLAQENTHVPQDVLREALGVDPRFHPEDHGLVGGFLEFRDFRFLIWLISEPFDSFTTESRNGIPFGFNGNAVHPHPEALRFQFNSVLSHEIVFTW